MADDGRDVIDENTDPKRAVIRRTQVSVRILSAVFAISGLAYIARIWSIIRAPALMQVVWYLAVSWPRIGLPLTEANQWRILVFTGDSLKCIRSSLQHKTNETCQSISYTHRPYHCRHQRLHLAKLSAFQNAWRRL
jgi:hypothetical protein